MISLHVIQAHFDDKKLNPCGQRHPSCHQARLHGTPVINVTNDMLMITSSPYIHCKKMFRNIIVILHPYQASSKQRTFCQWHSWGRLSRNCKCLICAISRHWLEKIRVPWSIDQAGIASQMQTGHVEVSNQHLKVKIDLSDIFHFNLLPSVRLLPQLSRFPRDESSLKIIGECPVSETHRSSSLPITCWVCLKYYV